MEYAIGSEKLPGLAKIVEECGELSTVAAKLMATDGNAKYFDGSNLREALIGEMADVMAALHFFCGVNDIDEDVVVDRAAKKLQQYIEWHTEQQHASRRE